MYKVILFLLFFYVCLGLLDDLKRTRYVENCTVACESVHAEFSIYRADSSGLTSCVCAREDGSVLSFIRDGNTNTVSIVNNEL